MADEYELNAKITADDSGFQAAFGRLEQSLGGWGIHLDQMYNKGASFFKGFGIDIDQMASRLGTTGPMLAGSIGIAITAFTTLKKVIADTTAEWAEDETAQLKFNAAISANEKMTNGAIERLEKLATTFGLLTGNTTASVQSQIAMLSATGRTEEQINKMITAAQGLATATGTDLNTALIQINQTFSGTTGRLGRTTPELNALTKEELENGKAVDILNAKYGEFSKTLSGSSAVSISNYKNQIGELKSALGQMFEQAIKPIRDGLTSMITYLVEHKDIMIGVFNGLAVGLSMVLAAFNPVLGGIALVVSGLFALQSATGGWKALWLETKGVFLGVSKTILDGVSGMVNITSGAINLLLKAYNAIVKIVGGKPIQLIDPIDIANSTGISKALEENGKELAKVREENAKLAEQSKNTKKSQLADIDDVTKARKTAEEEYQKAQKATQDKFDLGVINYAEKIEQQKSNLNTLINKLIDLGDTNSSVLLAAIAEWKTLGGEIDAFNGKVIDAAQNMRDFKAMEREWEASQKALNDALLKEQDGFLQKELANYDAQNEVDKKLRDEKEIAEAESLSKRLQLQEKKNHKEEQLGQEDRIEKYRINEAILEDGLLFLSRELENYKATISKEVEYRGDAVEQDKKLMAEQNDALLKAYADYLGISIEKLKELIEARKQAEIDMADISIATQNKLQDEQLNALIRALAEYNGISFDAMKKRLANEETAEKDAIDFKTSMAQLALDNSENLQKESYDNLIQALADYNGLSLAAMKKKLKDEEEAISVSNQLRLSMAELAIDNEKALLDDSYNNLIRALAEYNGISFAEMQAVIKNEQEKEAAAARWRAFRQSENNAELSDQEKLANDLLNYQDGALERELKDYQTVTDNQKTELEKRKTGWDSYGAYLDEMRQKQKEKDAADNAAKVANFVSAMRTIQRSVSQVFRAIGGEGSNILSDFADTVTNIASAAAQGFNNVGADIQAAVSLIGLAGEANAEKLKTLQDGLGELAGELMAALAPALELVLDLLIAFMPILKPIIQIIGVILNALKPLFDIIKAIADIIVYLMGGFFKIIAWLLGIKDTTEQVTDATTSYADALKDVNDELKDNKDLFTDASNSANAYTSILTKVTKKVADFYKSLQDVGTDIATTLVDNLTSGLTESDFLTSMKEYIIKMVIQAAVFTAELSDKIAAIGKMIADGIANGMSETDLASIRAQLQALYQSASTAAAQATAIVDTSFAGYASGTSSATEGAHKLAESGPELVVNPTVRYLNQGTKVYNAQDTAKILSGNKSTVVNATFNSPKALSAYDMQRKMRQYNRSLAFNGVL